MWTDSSVLLLCYSKVRKPAANSSYRPETEDTELWSAVTVIHHNEKKLFTTSLSYVMRFQSLMYIFVHMNKSRTMQSDEDNDMNWLRASA